MMVCVLVPLIFAVLLIGTSASLSSSGAAQASACPPRWLLFGQRCFAFYPVWTTWSTADFMCYQTGGNLASVHTPEERQFVRQLANTNTPVWLGEYHTQQNDSLFWRDNSILRISGWTNQEGKTREGGVCLQMEPIGGELHLAPCGDLSFYVCSSKARSELFPKSRTPVEPGLVPNVSLSDVLWDHTHSDLLAEEILRSSTFLRKLWSGHLTQDCYTSIMQQEALYLQRVSSTLEALVSSLQEADDMRSLLLDTLKRYSSRNQSLPASPPPQWLRFSLQSFHTVVLDEPVYWLVALSARACLRDFLLRELLSSERGRDILLLSGSEEEANSCSQEWREESLTEVTWTQRYRKLIEEHQDQMDVFKSINIFREHMMNQKSFYKAAACDDK